jgi:lipopolysaccharide biosynthesis glycosyltransferase
MKTAIVTLAVGQQALQIYKLVAPFFQYYAEKTESDFVALTSKIINCSYAHLEKFQIYDLLDTIYDRVIYFDVDIIVQPKCINLFKIIPEDCIGAVYDCKDNNELNDNRKCEIVNIQSQLGDVNWENGYINTGVIVLSKQHKNIFTEPELRNEIKSNYRDQTLLNYNIKKNNFKIYKLDKMYNGMEINGYSSRRRVKEHQKLIDNKLEASVMHFAHEGVKLKQIAKYVPLLKTQIKKDKTEESPIYFNKYEIESRIEREKEEEQLVEQIIDQHGNKNINVYYDISELGWSQYLAAHLEWLKQNNTPAGVICPRSKNVLYRKSALFILPYPNEYVDKFGHLPSDGNHLFDPVLNARVKDHDLLSAPFKNAYPQFDIVTKYSKFENQRIFTKYNHSAKAEEYARLMTENMPAIIVFPRYRTSKFRARNVPEKLWFSIINGISKSFPNHKIISIGSRNGAYNLQVKRIPHFINLVPFNDDETLDILVALCNTGIATMTVGNQSGTVKVALLSGTPSYMFGNEMKRHMVDENWAQTQCRFWTVTSTPDGFKIPNIHVMVNEIVNFGKIICKEKGIKQ